MSIHEAMEQQQISISKAGIVTSLQARCSVIAAANPVKGTYNQTLNFNENVDLTDPILSRFDLLAVVKDDANEEHDDALATFVINSHIKNHKEYIDMRKAVGDDEEKDKVEQLIDQELSQRLLPNNRLERTQEGLIDFEMMKKYLIYAKRFVKPKLSEIDQDKITSFYADIRRESNIVGGIPIAVRHIESVIRMSEAYAKLHLREHVRADDIDNAIDMLLDSFIQSQKLSVARQLSKKFEKYKTRETDSTQLLFHTLQKIVRDRAIYEKAIQGLDDMEKVIVKVNLDYFENETKDFSSHNRIDFYKSAKFLKQYRLEDNKIVTINKV